MSLKGAGVDLWEVYQGRYLLEYTKVKTKR